MQVHFFRPHLALTILLLAGCETVQSHNQSCDMEQSYLCNESSVISPEEASGILVGMSLAEVLRTLGPAKRDIGSSMYIVEWTISDGRTLRVSATLELCSKVVKTIID